MAGQKWKKVKRDSFSVSYCGSEFYCSLVGAHVF